MHCIVARIFSVLNSRVIGRLVVIEARVMLHRLAPTPAVSGVPISGVTSQISAGFGFSEAFQRSSERPGSQGWLKAWQPRILDLLCHFQTGTSFTILRHLIGSSPDHAADHVPTIEPHRPGVPEAPSAIVRESAKQSQMWLSHQAQCTGVTQIITNAWNARRDMKTCGSDHSEGTRCGIPARPAPGRIGALLGSALKRSSSCLYTVLPDSFVPL